MSADILLFGVLVAAIYLLIIAPARNRSKRAADIKAHLKPGAEVMTSSGLFGTVVSAEESEFHIEVSPGVVMRFAIGAVGKITVPTGDDKSAGENVDLDKHVDGSPDGDKSV